MQPDSSLPKARSQGLVVQKLTDETMVFDQQTNKAHCLNKVASMVWQHCDGQTKCQDVAQQLGRATGIAADTQAVAVVLQDLDQAGLLAEPAGKPSLSRREVAARLGAGAAFLLAPLVTSVLTQSAQAQASPGGGGGGGGGGGTTTPTPG